MQSEEADKDTVKKKAAKKKKKIERRKYNF